jgi:hypothetical protein
MRRPEIGVEPGLGLWLRRVGGIGVGAEHNDGLGAAGGEGAKWIAVFESLGK